MKKRLYWEYEPQAIEILRKMWADHTSEEIARVIGFSKGSIQRKGHDLYLTKSPAFIKKHPQVHNFYVRSQRNPDERICDPSKRINHPSPGVTVHRILG